MLTLSSYVYLVLIEFLVHECLGSDHLLLRRNRHTQHFAGWAAFMVRVVRVRALDLELLPADYGGGFGHPSLVTSGA